MVIVDNAMQARHREGNPILVGLVGAGVKGRMVTLQLQTAGLGVRLAAIANRTPENAVRAYREAGISFTSIVTSLDQLEDSVKWGRRVVTDDAMLLCRASNIDVIIEATGTVEFGVGVVLKAIENRKHVILMNAELDSTLGPILKTYADQAGVVFTNTDGDEPGVAMTLLRYLRSVGLRPVAAGNLKGMINQYLTPETQRNFAAKHGQNPVKVTSFADGTKLSMEATILANATGFKVGKRGMYGPRCAHVKEIADRLPMGQLLDGGMVDYALGAEPHTGAFVIAYEDHPEKKKLLSYFKLGEGPLYVFYTPYHLPHVQLVSTIGRATLFHDATVTPAGPPVCEVATVAKRDLKSGELLDGVGGFTSYGMIDNAHVCRSENLLPMGLSKGCRLTHGLRKDHPVSFGDVEVPEGRLCDKLWAEQTMKFLGKSKSDVA